MAFLQACLIGTASAATSVSQFGITWTFDRDYTTGQFANGDYWVVGPVKITSITPRSVVVDGQTMHGSMINPIPDTAQGFDSRIQNNPFDGNKNVARAFPFTVPVNSSLLSCESNVTTVTGNDAQMRTIAILTVLSSPAPAGSFRPAYAGSDKTIRWNKSNLVYSKLRSLPPVAYTPVLSTVESWFERPIIELRSPWNGDYMHPATNSPSYGREITHRVGQGMLVLQLNYTAAQKEKLLVRLVQWGLDIYGSASSGMTWPNDGGHNQGRKPAMLFAGAVLNDASILASADAKQRFIFQEDQQTFYVSQADVDRPRKTSDGRQRDPYTTAMIGTPEWGGKHVGEPQGDAAQWGCSYRNVCGASTVGTVLAARLMSLESKWNWAPLFDYVDRFYKNDAPISGTGTNQIQPFVKEMWIAYRNSSGDYTPDNTSTAEVWQTQSFTEQTGAFSCAFDMVASQANTEAYTGLTVASADAVTDLLASVRFAPSGVIEAANGSTYQATTAVPYTAGLKYRVVISADLATDKYSVSVTPQNGTAVNLAQNYSFRTAATKLASLDFMAKAGAHSVLNVSVTTASVPTTPPPTTPPTSATLTNGNFENGLTNWTTSGNLYAGTASNGSKVVGFNGGNSTPNGIVSQTIATVSGTSYTLKFDVGVVAFNTLEQRLSLTVQGATTLASGTTSVVGKGSGTNVWKTVSYTFVANSATTTLTFKDTSPTSDSLDLMLDNVVLTAAAVPSAPAILTLTNGNFENGLTSWTTSGNLYAGTASNGSKVVGFNGGNSTPNGIVSQTVSTVSGTSYTLKFDVGVVAFNTQEQRLSLTVQGATTLASGTTSVVGKGSGTNVWKTVSYTFVANSATTTLTFKDTSTTSDSLDLMLDNVVLTAAAATSTPTVPAAPVIATLVNGDFENGITGWSGSGNRSTGTASNGSNVIVFNGGNTAPNGTVIQSFATTSGTSYTVTFDIGVLAYNTKEQRLTVTAQGSTVRMTNTAALNGKGGGATVWKSVSYTFVADSSTTTLTLKDTSASTDSLDLMLDNVRLAQ